MTSFYQELNQSEKMSDEKENAQSRAGVDKWIFRLLLLLLGVMPLIVLANVEQVVSPLISNVDVLTSGAKGDLFTHYKALFVIVITIITGVMLLAKVFFMDGKIQKTPINYAIGLFAFAIIMSTVFSPNITIALNGQYNRSDGAISWLCYLALMFIAMNIEYPKNVIKYIMYTMIPFVFINLFIITMNFYGKDLLQYGWMQSLVSMALPEGASISEGSTLVGTLNQWNYMSGMFAIMTGMYLIWAIVEKTRLNIILGLITSVAALSVMLMSLSTSGFVTITALTLLILIIALKKTNKLKGILLIISLLVIIVPIFHILAEKNPRIWSESIGFIIKTNPYVENSKTTSLNIKSDINVQIMNKAYASESILELPVLPETGISAGTGRTYIWEKTLNLVKEKPLVGYGLDSLAYRFPHNNIEARSGLRTENTIVDKPHNMYVGILYGTGILGMLGFIGIVLLSLVKAFKIVIKKQGTDTVILVIGWLGFLLQSVFNDPLPGTVAPSWIIVGIMLSLLFSNNNAKSVKV